MVKHWNTRPAASVHPVVNVVQGCNQLWGPFSGVMVKSVYMIYTDMLSIVKAIYIYIDMQTIECVTDLPSVTCVKSYHLNLLECCARSYEKT